MRFTGLLLVVLSLAACGSSGNPGAPADGGVDSSLGSAEGGQDASTNDAGDAAGDAPWPLDAGSDAPGDGSGAACPPPLPGPDAGAPITVSGTVVDAYDGAPATVSVTIQGHTTASAADGTFTLAGIAPPYDVLLDDGSGDHTAYLGLTRADPTLLSMRWSDEQPPSFQAVAGSLTSGGAPLDAGLNQLVGAVIDLSSVSLGTVTGSLKQPFVVQAEWGASPTASGTLWGFTADAVLGGGTTAFTAIGSVPISLDGGSPIQGVTLPVGTTGLTPATLSGTATGSFAAGGTSIYLFLGHGAQGGTQLFLDTSHTANPVSFSYGTFTGSPLTWAVSVSGEVLHGNYNSPCTVVRASLAGNETLTLPAPSTTTSVTQPPFSETVPGACVDFAWSTTTPGSVYVATLAPGGLGGAYYAIVTDRSSFRVPYTVLGNSYVWDVNEFPQQTSVDAVTTSLASALPVSASASVLLVDTAWCTAQQGQITVP